MRDIKFKMWDSVKNRMFSWEEITNETEHSEPIVHLATLLKFEYASLIPIEYTGLTDKNGIEIYEGDIIVNTCGSNFKVVRGDMQWVISNNENYYIGWVPDRVEVIGNILQNFELLKENER